jgi:hypothetical protein
MAVRGSQASLKRGLRPPLLVGTIPVFLGLSACLSFAGLTGGDGGADAKAVSDAGVSDTGKDLGAGDAPIDCGTFTQPAASSLRDSFDGSVLPTGWFIPGDSTCAQQQNGDLVARADTSYCLAFTTSSYHLTCSSVTVKVPETTAPVAYVQTVMYLDTSLPDGGTQETALILQGGNFVFRLPSALNLGITNYEPDRDVWWRLRESGGTLYFDTSMDGKNFTNRGSTNQAPSLDDVTIGLGAGEYMPVPDAGEAKFRCYNLLPPFCQ